MGFVLLGLVFLFFIVGAVCHLAILVCAFQDDAMQGILCFCIPGYIIYYAIAVFDNEHKKIILLGWAGSIVANLVLYILVIALAVATA